MPENLHMTLAFLGEREAATVECIHDAASSVCAPPFSFKVGRYDMFTKQRLLVAVPTKIPPELLSLRKRLLQALRHCGINLSGRFHPHVTLFRNMRAPLPEQNLPQSVEWRITSFALVESVLKSDRAHYASLHEYELNAA